MSEEDPTDAPLDAPPPTPPVAPDDRQFAMPDFNTYKQTLDPELRDQPSIQNIESFEGLIREHANVQKFIGSDKIAKPGKDAPLEDWDRFYGAMGRPDQPEKYDLGDFTPPDNVVWDGEFQTRMLSHLHKHGASNRQAVGILKDYAAEQAEMMQNARSSSHLRQEEAMAALEKKWGGATDANTEIAHRAFKKTFGDDFEKIANAQLDGVPIGDNPAFMEAFYRIGKEMNDHGMIGDPSRKVTPVMTPNEAKQRIQQIESDPEFQAIMADPNQSNHPKKVEWSNLYDIVDG